MTATLPLWRDPARVGIVSRPVPGEVDVAVIGAGIIGLSAMHHLTAAGKSAVLLEAGQPGSASSTTGSGVVGWSRAAADPSEIDPRASGYAGVADAVDGAQAWFGEFASTNALDVDLEIPGSVSITGPFDPGPLGTVHPGKLVDALVQSIGAAGGSIVVDEPLRTASRHTKGYQLLSSRQKISARTVIVATGAASGPHPLSELHKRYRIVRGRCLVVRSDPGAMDQLIPPNRTTYLASNAIIVARRIGDTGGLIWYPRLGRRRAAMEPSALLASTVPTLRNADVTHDWWDDYATTHDGVPRIGRINAAWYAGGASDPALGALLGHHVAGLTIGTMESSPFAEIPHAYAWTDRVRAQLQGHRKRAGRAIASE